MQVPLEQHAPLHAWVAEHEVVHAPVAVSQARPAAQSEVCVQKGWHAPISHASPAAHANVDPQPPQLLRSVW